MNWFKKQWEVFKAKSFLGKFWDVLFVVVIIMFLIPDGRMLIQRGILKTGLMGSTTSNEDIKLDSNALSWRLMDLEGRQLTLGELSDRPVFINFWATWCPPCKAEMPSIISLMEKAGDQSHFILVTSEEREKVVAFLDRQGWDLPVYFPLSDYPPQLSAASLPTSMVISTDGKIIHRSEGMRDWASKEAVELVTGK